MLAAQGSRAPPSGPLDGRQDDTVKATLSARVSTEEQGQRFSLPTQLYFRCQFPAERGSMWWLTLLVVLLLLGCASPRRTTQSPAPPPSGLGSELQGVAGPSGTAPLATAQPVVDTPSGRAGAVSCDEQTAYQRVHPSVVMVINNRAGNQIASGTGYAVRSGREVLTNAHVVDKALALWVILRNGRQVPARLLRTDERRDLALLDLGDVVLPAVNFSTDEVRPGQRVLALGFPRPEVLGGEPTLTSGIVSSVRTIDGVQLIQTDTPVNPGNSGGPLFTVCGDVVGTVRASVRQAVGLNLAVSVPEIQAFLNQSGGTIGASTPVARSPSTGILAVSGDWLVTDFIRAGPGAGTQATFRVRLTQTGAMVTGTGDLTLFGHLEGTTLRARYTHLSGGGELIWAFSADGTGFAGTFTNASLGNHGESLGQRWAEASPWQVVSLFYTLLSGQRYEEAYALLSPRFQAQLPWPRWRAGYTTTLAIVIEAVEAVSPSPPTVAVRMLAADLIDGQRLVRRFAGTWTLVRTAEGWKLDVGRIQVVP